MRLICPSCEAQYEIPDEMIPEEGRDVQCADCEHTWFQPPPLIRAGANGTAKAGKKSAPNPPGRELAADVLSILREEATREQRARAGEDVTADTGTDTVPAKAPSEPGTGDNDLPDFVSLSASLDRLDQTGARQAETGEEPRPAPVAKRGAGRGFRFGFWLSVAIFAIAALLYVFAPWIGARWPDLQGGLAGYATWVDGVRAWLDVQIGKLTG